MATLLGQVHWDATNEKVVTTYQVLSTGPDDKIQFVNGDSQPFVVQTDDKEFVKEFGLKKAKNSDGLKDLYEVKASGVKPKIFTGGPSGAQLKCGTLDKNLHFDPWPTGWGTDPGKRAMPRTGPNYRKKP